MLAKVDGNEFLLVDTPGFNDTWKDFRRSDAKILGEIAQTLTLQSQLGIKLVRQFPSGERCPSKTADARSEESSTSTT